MKKSAPVSRGAYGCQAFSLLFGAGAGCAGAAGTNGAFARCAFTAAFAFFLSLLGQYGSR